MASLDVALTRWASKFSASSGGFEPHQSITRRYAVAWAPRDGPKPSLLVWRSKRPSQNIEAGAACRCWLSPMVCPELGILCRRISWPAP